MSDSLSTLNASITGDSTGVTSERFPGVPQPATVDSKESNPIQTLGEIALSVTLSATGLMQAARTAYCAGLALTNPMMLLDTVGLMAKGASSLVLDMAERMAELIKSQITGALSQINSSFSNLAQNALGFVDGLKKFINSIDNLLSSIKNFVDNVKITANLEYEDFCSKEDCEFMFAMMGACLLSKLMGNKLQELEQKVSSKIMDAGASLNEAVAEGLAGVNNISGYLEREKFMLEKAAVQMDGLQNIIASGGAGVTVGPLTVNATAEITNVPNQEVEQKSSLINQAIDRVKNSSLVSKAKNK